MCDKWHKIINILQKFNKFYWNSELVNNISLINDLRLSTNIHETAHSRILYKLLCAHGKESRQFLKLFLEVVGLRIELDIDNTEIKVEYQHIDVLIYDGKKSIIIENKVNHACDQDRQLEDYINKRNGGDVYVLYLVRFDNDNNPSDNSLPLERRLVLEKEGKYEKISYQTHILKWLHRCEKETCNEVLKSALIQYSNYIEDLFKETENMNDEDIKNFEKILLNSETIADPVHLVEKIDELKQNIINLKMIVESYEDSLCKRYLEYFKKETQIKDSRLNSSHQIEFCIQIHGVKVQFIYDFLKHYQYVWFGAKYPLNGWDGKDFDSNKNDDFKKIIEKSRMEGYRLDKIDNYSECVGNNFKSFYSDKEYFCKYCKDNNSAIKEIIQFKKNVENMTSIQ